MATFEELKKQYDALWKELTDVGNQLGATAGIMPFVKPDKDAISKLERYNKIWDELGKLRWQLLSN